VKRLRASWDPEPHGADAFERVRLSTVPPGFRFSDHLIVERGHTRQTMPAILLAISVIGIVILGLQKQLVTKPGSRHEISIHSIPVASPKR